MATARTLDQIIAELNPTFQAQTNSLQQQMGLIPEQIKTQEAALNAQKDQGYADIISGARRRGTGIAFGGIPLSEQAKYNATTYAPALANLRTAGTQQATSLQDAINAINERRDTLGQNIYQTEQQRQFEAEQAALNRQASAANAITPTMLSSILGNTSNNSASTPSLPKIIKNDTGYNFTDPYGEPVTAAEYVQLYQNQGGKLTYRQLLQQMANDGDSNAKIALNYVGDDAKFGSAPSQYRGALEALGATGTYQQEQQATKINNNPRLKYQYGRR